MKHTPHRGTQPPDDRVVFSSLLATDLLPSKNLVRVIALRRRVRAMLGVETVRAMVVERCQRVGGNMFLY